MRTIGQRRSLDVSLPSPPSGTVPQLMLIGTSYKSSPIGFRETLARKVGGDHIGESLSATESALLSTCNRFEVYFTSRNPDESFASFLGRAHELTGFDGMESSFYQLRGPQAVRHLFRVAAGLESVVVGEPQILAQVRKAGVDSRRRGDAGAILSPMFDRAYMVGARLRAAYGLESEEASLSDLAVDAIGELSPGRHDVMLVGTGKMVRLAARRLERSARRLYVVSRRKTRPAGLEWCTLVRYADMGKVAAKCDVLISATTAGRPLITPAELKGRKKRIVVDLGMPRNVSESVRRMRNVRLIDLDDLARLARPGRYAGKLEGAESAATREASEFYDWLVQTRLTSTLADLYAWADSMRMEELKRATGKLNPKTKREERILEAMSRRIVSKMLARPAQFARRKQDGLSEEEKLDLLGSVFGTGASGEK